MDVKRIKRLAMVLPLAAALVVVGTSSVRGADQVTVSVPASVQAGPVDVYMKIDNDTSIQSVGLPVVVRSLSGGAYVKFAKMAYRDRLPSGSGNPLSDLQISNHYWNEDGMCKSAGPGGFGSLNRQNDTLMRPVPSMPVAFYYFRNTFLFSPRLPAGSDATGSLLLSMIVNCEADTGMFEIDTTCTNPANHVLYGTTGVKGRFPAFTKATFEVIRGQGAIPPAPQNLSPLDGTRDGDTVTFQWDAVVSSRGASAIAGYQIRIDSVSDAFHNVFFTDTTSATSIEVILRREYLTVYWQVKALGIPPDGDGPWTSPTMYTDVEEISASAPVPETYHLAQNYPNPFNASTVIQYKNRTDGRVRLEVFNILGQSVVTLLDEYRPLGTHTVTWDGTDARGRAVPSGMYFYRLEAEDFSDVKKMVLLK